MSELSTADYRRLVDLLEAHSSRSMEAMRVMLGAMKQAGWTDFDTCWSNAIQRIRVQPYMDEDEATELLEDKQRLVEAKPGFRRAFNGQNIGTDVFQGGTAENDSADSGIADH